MRTSAIPLILASAVFESSPRIEPCAPQTQQPSIVMTVFADAPGNDNQNPNGEYVTIGNTGDSVLRIGGWTLCDAASHCFRFPQTAELIPRREIRVHRHRSGRFGQLLHEPAKCGVEQRPRCRHPARRRRRRRTRLRISVNEQGQSTSGTAEDLLSHLPGRKGMWQQLHCAKPHLPSASWVCLQRRLIRGMRSE